MGNISQRPYHFQNSDGSIDTRKFNEMWEKYSRNKTCLSFNEAKKLLQDMFFDFGVSASGDKAALVLQKYYERKKERQESLVKQYSIDSYEPEVRAKSPNNSNNEEWLVEDEEGTVSKPFQTQTELQTQKVGTDFCDCFVNSACTNSGNCCDPNCYLNDIGNCSMVNSSPNTTHEVSRQRTTRSNSIINSLFYFMSIPRGTNSSTTSQGQAQSTLSSSWPPSNGLSLLCTSSQSISSPCLPLGPSSPATQSPPSSPMSTPPPSPPLLSINSHTGYCDGLQNMGFYYEDFLWIVYETSCDRSFHISLSRSLLHKVEYLRLLKNGDLSAVTTKFHSSPLIESGFSLIPSTILYFKIFYYLDDRSLCNVFQVCKRWSKASKQAPLWMSLAADVYTSQGKCLQTVLKKGRSPSSVSGDSVCQGNHHHHHNHHSHLHHHNNHCHHNHARNHHSQSHSHSHSHSHCIHNSRSHSNYHHSHGQEVNGPTVCQSCRKPQIMDLNKASRSSVASDVGIIIRSASTSQLETKSNSPPGVQSTLTRQLTASSIHAGFAPQISNSPPSGIHISSSPPNSHIQTSQSLSSSSAPLSCICLLSPVTQTVVIQQNTEKNNKEDEELTETILHEKNWKWVYLSKLLVRASTVKKFSGTGRLIASEYVYEGDLMTGQRHGFGTTHWTNKNWHRGHYHHGKRNGWGVFVYFQNGRYEGNFEEDYRSGFGKFRWPNGSSYEGLWKEGKKDGKGLYRWFSGDVYEGSYINDIRTGLGRMTWCNGNWYEGDFVKNKRTGRGVFHWIDGRVYEGDFVDNVRVGQGTFEWPDGTRYEGRFQGGKKSGPGRLFFSSGEVLSANFSEDALDGDGQILYQYGMSVKLSSADAEFIRSIKEKYATFKL